MAYTPPARGLKVSPGSIAPIPPPPRATLAAVMMSTLTCFRPRPPAGCSGPDVAVGRGAGVAPRAVGLAALAGVAEGGGGGVAEELGDGRGVAVALGGGGVPGAIAPAATLVGPARGVRPGGG